MNKQRKILITITYNEMGIIIDTKAEELDSYAQPEIIRCKDCKWYRGIGCAIKIVDESDEPTDNDFCSYGERKNE